jgi:hypothetical protein
MLLIRRRPSSAAPWEEIGRETDPRIALKLASDEWLARPHWQIEIVDGDGDAVQLRKVVQRETGDDASERRQA